MTSPLTFEEFSSRFQIYIGPEEDSMHSEATSRASTPGLEDLEDLDSSVSEMSTRSSQDVAEQVQEVSEEVLARLNQEIEEVDVETARTRTCFKIGSEGSIMSQVSLQKDDVAMRVDRAFQQMKQAIRIRLCEDGTISEEEANQFKMVFSHRNSIAFWWIEGSDNAQRGTYDPFNDNHILSTHVRQIVVQSAKEIEKATVALSGSHFGLQKEVLVGSLGSLGLGSLTHLLTPNSYGGTLPSVKQENHSFDAYIEKQIQAHQDALQSYIEQEYINIAEKAEGARQLQPVLQDLTAILVFRGVATEKLRQLDMSLRTQLQAAQNAEEGHSSENIWRLKEQLKQVQNIRGLFANQHLQPYFVSKSYEKETTGTTIAQVNRLRKKFEQHYAAIDRPQGLLTSIKNKLARSSNYELPASLKELSFRLAAKEVYRPDQRYEFLKHCRDLRLNDSALGLEEAFFDRMLRNLGGEYEKNPLFEKLNPTLQVEIHNALRTAHEHVRTQLAESSESTEEDAKKLLTEAKQQLHQAFRAVFPVTPAPEDAGDDPA